MSDATLESYLATWREANPQRAIAWWFLRPEERIRFGGLGALQQEWLNAVHTIAEPGVAAVKLSWWREEMQRATRGETRHPLTQALFADEQIRRLPLSCWTTAVDAALLARDAPPASDFAAQRRAVQPLAGAFAALETRLAFGAGAVSPRATEMAALDQLTANVRALPTEIQSGRTPLPMNLLARHGLVTDALARDGPARRAALHDYAVELAQTIADAMGLEGPLTLLRRVDVQRDRRSLRAAIHSEDPLVGLGSQSGGPRDLFQIWRAARIWRRVRQNVRGPEEPG